MTAPGRSKVGRANTLAQTGALKMVGTAMTARALAAFAVFIALAGFAPARADSLYDRAFKARLTDYADPATLGAFVGQAVRTGQYDQAISTLEQVIFQDPGDAGARLTLARLYFHVGSFDLAMGHVNEALALGVPSLEVSLRQLKARIERARQPVRAHLDVTAGGQIVHRRAAFPTGFAAGTSQTNVGGYAMIDGRVVFDPDTATRDLVLLDAGISVDRPFLDTDFNGTGDGFTALAGHGALTLSKGLPDAIDTLRADLTLFGDYEDLGGGRDKRELGVRTRIGFRPSVETQIYLDASYGWLGESRALFADDQWSVGVGARYRIAPGWTADGFVRHYQRRGTVPAAVLGGTAFGYRTDGTEGGAALTHLLHVFEDGRAWFQTLAASYADDTILDYGAVGAGRGALVKGRQVWRVDWDHTVQMSAQGRLRFGVGYHHERIGPGGTGSRTDAWTGRLRYTYRFD